MESSLPPPQTPTTPIGSLAGPQTPQTPRPLFIYGTLCARPLLAWAMTGSAENVDQVSRLLKPARVMGYKRVAVHHCDYPAVVKDDGSTVDGFVLQPQTASQRRKLDDFEGEAYKPVTVTAHLQNITNDNPECTVDADMYLWDGDMDKLSTESWGLEEFIATRLEDWIDLFDGMELVGDDIN